MSDHAALRPWSINKFESHHPDYQSAVNNWQPAVSFNVNQVCPTNSSISAFEINFALLMG